MSSSRLVLAAAFIAALGIHSASALEVEDANTKAGINLTDPDDSVPVAHLDDDGKMQQPNSGFNLQVHGGSQSSGNSNLNAFERAQQNQMGQ